MKSKISKYAYNSLLILAAVVNTGYMVYHLYAKEYSEAVNNLIMLGFLGFLIMIDWLFSRKDKHITGLLALIKNHENLQEMYEVLNKSYKATIEEQKSQIETLKRTISNQEEILAIYQEKQVKKPIVKKKTVSPVASTK